MDSLDSGLDSLADSYDSNGDFTSEDRDIVVENPGEFYDDERDIDRDCDVIVAENVGVVASPSANNTNDTILVEIKREQSECCY